MKSILIILCFLFPKILFSQYIMGLHITQNGANQIKTHLKVYLPTLGEFRNHLVQINQNQITLSTCYFMTDLGAISELDNDFFIDIPNYGNYSLVVNMYTSSDPVTCSYSNLEDTVNLNFSTPIDGTVSLASSEIEHKNFKLYPVPAKDELHIRTNEIIQKVSVYDISGKIIPVKLNQHTINTISLKNGTYFIRMETEKGIVTQKFIIQKQE